MGGKYFLIFMVIPCLFHPLFPQPLAVFVSPLTIRLNDEAETPILLTGSLCVI